MNVLDLPKCPVCERELNALFIKPESDLYEMASGTSYHMRAQFLCGAVAEKPPSKTDYHWIVG